MNFLGIFLKNKNLKCFLILFKNMCFESKYLKIFKNLKIIFTKYKIRKQAS